jgi:hypothetical protein
VLLPSQLLLRRIGELVAQQQATRSYLMMSTVSLPRRRLLLLQLLSLSFLLLALHTQCSALKHTIVGGPDATPLEDEVAPEPPSHQALRDANKRAMFKAAAVEARCDRRVARKARALVQTHVWDVVNAYGTHGSM